MNTNTNTTDTTATISPVLAAMLAGDVAPTETPRGIGHVDALGAARSAADKAAADKAAAVASGFSPADPIYTRGTRVIQLGVENARRSRVEHDAKPTVASYCADLVAQIAAEKRQDKTVPVRELTMAEDGRLVRGANSLAITEPAFKGLYSRLGIPGASYLAAIPTDRRAANFDADIADIAATEDAAASEPREVTLRLRRTTAGAPECFAVVGERYTAFDADKIAEAIALASPDSARGTVAYDGRRTKFEVMFHTTTQPEHFVAGEYFRAGVIVTTDDTGGGGIRVKACIFQNLCLNLIILDRSEQHIASLRHIGSIEKLAEKFRVAFAAALDSIGHFVRAWDRAVEEDLVATTAAQGFDLSVDSVMPGIFNALIEDGDMGLPKRNRLDVVDTLMDLWRSDDSGAAGATRAAAVNAITRWAHVVNDDVFAEDELQSAAGALLYGRGNAAPAPLKYLPLPTR